jgi:ABC-type multidrug transport system ATPase subunit
MPDSPPQCCLKFESLTYTVETSANGTPASAFDKIKKTTKQRKLLINVNAEVTSGHVLAILGPSGAGKTTLLNMLTLEKKGGDPVGHIWLNGKPLTLDDYDQHCAYVQQFDTLWSSLTARDHLVYAMSLFLYTKWRARTNDWRSIEPHSVSSRRKVPNGTCRQSTW